jgi:para-nitrobenzyl esterase
MKQKYLLSLLLLTITFLTAHSQIVTTQFGQIRGKMNGLVYEFLGIPFATPPVDSLRWRAPREPSAWTGVLSTATFAPVCPQKRYGQGDTVSTMEGNEDCLYLNIWTPETGPGNRPVLVFIHGGGNQQGGASESGGGTQMFVGKNMAERGNAVIVTIQYRLGPLGFLVHPGLESENPLGVSGNYAVMDQILALTWIKNNIGQFGGDATKVMIFGESAGGVNVGNLLISPLASGLFQRACIESAGPVVNSYLDSKSKGTAYVEGFHPTGTDVQKIAFMRSLPSDSLIRELSSPLVGGIVQMNWQPVIDHVVFNDIPSRVIQSGNYNKVPLMIGSNSEEASLSAPSIVLPAMVTGLINSYVPPSLKAEANQLYPPGATTAQARISYVNMLTDAQFTSVTRRTAQCVSLNQTDPVWRYFFTFKHTLPALAALGSYHGMELFYVFNNWENATLGEGLFFKPQDDSVQKAMLQYWVNFANTGNPNGANLVNWPRYQNSLDNYLEIKAKPDGMQNGIRTIYSDFWDEVSGFSACTSSLYNEYPTDNSDVKVFPNPTSGILWIEPGNYSEPWTIDIFDVNGKKILSDVNLNKVDISGFCAGIYLINIIQNGKIHRVKILRQS